MLAEIGYTILVVSVILFIMWLIWLIRNWLFPHKTVDAVNMDAATDFEKKSFLIAFASYFATEWLGDKQYIESNTKRTLGEFLQREDVAELVTPSSSSSRGKSKAYELIWGPVIFQAKASLIADNTMYVAREKSDHSKLYVGVAGTHPLSVFSWLFQDFDIFNLVEWPYARRTE